MRRCDAKEAFSELVDVSTRRGLSPFALGRALVAAASGHPVPDSDAGAAVAEEWGELFVDTRVST